MTRLPCLPSPSRKNLTLVDTKTSLVISWNMSTWLPITSDARSPWCATPHAQCGPRRTPKFCVVRRAQATSNLLHRWLDVDLQHHRYHLARRLSGNRRQGPQSEALAQLDGAIQDFSSRPSQQKQSMTRLVAVKLIHLDLLNDMPGTDTPCRVSVIHRKPCAHPRKAPTPRSVCPQG